VIAQMDPLYIKTRPSKVVPRLISYALFEGRPLTTRGQWINPLVFAHFALETRLPQLKEVEKPIFVVGTGRSGSTILGLLMSMHRDVGFLNEPKALWHTIYPYGDVFGQYSSGPALYSLSESDATDEVRLRARRLFGAYLRAVASQRVVDKYPELIFRVPFVKTIFPDARFIFLVRNGWDTCRSIEGWSERKGTSEAGEVHDWWGANNRKWRLMLEQLVPREKVLADVVDAIKEFDHHSDMAAVEWIVTMREGLRRLEQYANCVHMVRYESLVENPRQELHHLLDFCELPHDEVFLAFGEKELSPTSKAEPFDMHPAIRAPFDDTMKALGY
jgi:hypothetical protein